MRLSAIVITHNEESNIQDCLKSLSFVDEIIVVDHASTDRTVEIARRLGAKVHSTEDWPGFGLQKNRALALATGDWVLSIDADERVTDGLRTGLTEALTDCQAVTAFQFPRESSYCGQFMRHSGWSPDWVLRLFKRGHARFSDDLVHERLMVKGSIGKVNSPLRHLSFPDFESVLDKANRYSTAGAQAMFKKGKSASLFGAIGHASWAFFRTYVLRRGFLDGELGLALAISNAEGTYYRYAKCWLLLRQARS